MEGLFFYFSKHRVTKGFKFHAQPQAGAYSCFLMASDSARWEDHLQKKIVQNGPSLQIL